MDTGILRAIGEFAQLKFVSGGSPVDSVHGQTVSQNADLSTDGGGYPRLYPQHTQPPLPEQFPAMGSGPRLNAFGALALG
jgi:hypothetical protein